ncbi:Rho GTPase activation protein with PH domain-containing protein [Perilla frutescens var. frutescens]|nr:Rho GTPase activation protein with PH domain-containing protein [Perilla frutescens var. frutescens]
MGSLSSSEPSLDDAGVVDIKSTSMISGKCDFFRDGRALTLKAETLEDLHEWKTALEEALSNAPNAALVTGQNGMFKNDQLNAGDASLDQVKDRQTAKSLVIGRPVLLALEDIDGTPSFLEKALRFLEERGEPLFLL